MHPGCAEFVFLCEEGVGDNKIVFCTLGQEENPTGIDVSFILFPNSVALCYVIPTKSGIEIPRKMILSSFGMPGRISCRLA